MDRDESIQLFEKCEAARKAALDAGKSEEEAHEAARSVWNGWAQTLLEEQKSLKQSNQWKIYNEYDADLDVFRDFGGNEETRNWLNNAHIELSSLQFSNSTQEITEYTSDLSSSNDNSKHLTLYCIKLVNFSGYIFPGFCNFSKSRFNCNVSFRRASFLREAWYEKTSFNNKVWFENINFSDNACFNETSFKEEAFFYKTLFSENVWCKKATFHNKTSFYKIKVSGNARFKNTIFLELVSFDGASFEGTANYENVHFNKNASFVETTFGGPVSLLGTHFLSEAFFFGVNTERGFDTASANFKNNVPNFIQANFKKSPRLDHIKVPIIGFWKSLITLPDIKNIGRFRILRGLAIDAHDYERERLFFKGEMRAKRGTEEWFYWNISWWFSVFYDFFSDFGKSVWRPFLAWVTLIPIFAWIYFLTATQKPCAEYLGNALYLAAQNALIFFAANRKKELSDAYECFYSDGNKLPEWLGLIGLGNTLLSAIFLFLMLLGVRNLFKIK